MADHQVGSAPAGKRAANVGANPSQTERAFQKQKNVFLNAKKLASKKTTSGVRYYKKIGLGRQPHGP